MKKQTLLLISNLTKLGFSVDEAQSLRRISMTLHRWAELECGDGNDHASWCVERDEETDKPFLVTYPHQGKSYRRPIADREKGALKRLEKILATHPGWTYHHQTDPRGCALYLIKKDDIPQGSSLCSCYHRGIAVCA